MRTSVWSRIIVLLIILLLPTSNIWAEKPFLIVTDNWPPYIMAVNGKATGVDVEITQAVFQQLGIEVNIRLYPWKRCLMMVKNREADAILSASITPERKEFLCFPEEPTSEGITVFFIKAGRKIKFTSLTDLNGLKVGAILGYRYCNEIDRSKFMQHAEQVGSIKQNLQKLLANRLDVVVEVDKVGYFEATQMDIVDQIDTIPKAAYCRGGNYLAFSKNSNCEQLASRFSNALKAFKTTVTYKKIRNSYGMEGNPGR